MAMAAGLWLGSTGRGRADVALCPPFSLMAVPVGREEKFPHCSLPQKLHLHAMEPP